MDTLVDEVDRSPDGPTTGAFFDFDGTLIYGFSAIALQIARLRRRDVPPQEFAHALITGVGIVLGQADYDAVVSVLGRSWRGREVDEIDALGRRLFKEKLAGRMYPEARALVAAHLRKGHTVVLASSALSFQVEAVAADLDIEHVLCTRFEVVDGRLTGALAGPHLWGMGKRRAVEQLAAEQGIDLARSFAYADGSEDVELLEVVGNPRPTNPTRGLERKARERELAGPPLRRSWRPDPRAGGAAPGRGRRLPRRDGDRDRPRSAQSPQGRRGQHHGVGRQRPQPRDRRASVSTSSVRSTCGRTAPRCSCSTTRARSIRSC